MSEPFALQHMAKIRAEFNRKIGNNRVVPKKDNSVQKADRSNESVAALLTERRALRVADECPFG